MIKANEYLIHDIRNILENGYRDENPRPVYADGTPAYTISVNHVTRKYDLSKGEFPICTLRPQAWKTGIREIFTIYQRPTNVLSEMRKMGVTWWDPWARPVGQREGHSLRQGGAPSAAAGDSRQPAYRYEGRRALSERLPCRQHFDNP